MKVSLPAPLYILLLVMVSAGPASAQVVIRDGKEWLQPADFLNYSWDEVNAVCPGGACSGTLPRSDIDLTGYTWASANEVASLIHDYIGDPQLYSYTGLRELRVEDVYGVSDNFKQESSPWAPEFLSDFQCTVCEDYECTQCYRPPWASEAVSGLGRDFHSEFEDSNFSIRVTDVLEDAKAKDSASITAQGAGPGGGRSSISGYWFWRSTGNSNPQPPTPEPPTPPDPKPGPWSIDGSVRSADGSDLCAMVLASGQFMFSCNPKGHFTLRNLPLEENGTVLRQVYASGFFPKVQTLQTAGTENVVLERASNCPNYNLPSNPSSDPASAGMSHSVSGRVLLQSSDTPLCALVLANGAHAFSCGSNVGSFSLSFPLDDQGQYKLQTYAAGFAPNVQTFSAFDNPYDVRMARASECRK